MFETIETQQAKRAAIGFAVLVAVLMGLVIFVSEFGHRSPTRLTALDTNDTIDGQSILSEVRRMPQNIYGYAGLPGLAKNVGTAAKWSEDEWRVAINAVNELRQKNDESSRAAGDGLQNGLWQPPQEIRSNPD